MLDVIILGAAHSHVNSLASTAATTEGLRLIGVFDHDAARADELAGRFKLATYASLDEALAHRPALVIIDAEPALRADYAARTLEAGAAALVDKPLALNDADLDDLIARAAGKSRQVVAYYPYRGFPELLSARKAIADGRIGRLVRIMAHGPHKQNAHLRPDWHWTRAGNGGIFMDIGAHHADLCLWMAGERPTWLLARQENHTQPDYPEFQDFALAMLRFPGGLLGSIELDWLNPTCMKNFGDTRFWFQGTGGKIEIRLGDERAAMLWDDSTCGQPLDLTGFPDCDAWTRKLMLDLAHGRPCGIEPRETWDATRLTLRLFDSAAAGGRPLENPFA